MHQRGFWSSGSYIFGTASRFPFSPVLSALKWRSGLRVCLVTRRNSGWTHSGLLIFGLPRSRSRKKWIESSRYMLHNQ